jgi:apolipoprotein N-acyltransferase
MAGLKLSWPWGLVFLSGLFLGMAQPFYTDSWPLANQNILGLLGFVGYVPLLLILEEQNLKNVFKRTFVAVLVQYSISLYWIYIAVHVHGHVPPIPASLITLALAAILALKAGLFFTLGSFLSNRYNISFLWIFPLVICAVEYFKNFYLFGGFPWGNVGYSVGRIDEILQVASLVGVYGLVFLVGAVNALFAKSLMPKAKRLVYFSLGIALIVSAYGFGALRLYGGQNEFSRKIPVAMLQGNIPQEVKSQGRLYANDILDIYKKLQSEAKAMGAKLVIWPESAYPRMLDENVQEVLEVEVASIVGATVFGEDKNGYHAHNSALLIDYLGHVVKRYDKSHLVPFGEYVPWPFSGVVDKIVPGMGAFLPGIEYVPEKLSLGPADQLMVGTTICYEGIFPEISRAYAKLGASLLVNITNDAWYGRSSAPFQHLLMYRMRSVESGLTFVRATNSGVSAWIDVYGRIHSPTKLFERQMILAQIPLLKKNTLYLIIGDVFAQISILLLLVSYIFAIIPIHKFVLERRYLKLLLVFFLSAVVVASTFYYSDARFLTDESARTKILFIFLLCLLLMVGLLTKGPRSRSVLITCATILVILCGLLAIFESLYFLVGVLLGLLIYLLAFRMNLKPTEKKL